MVIVPGECVCGLPLAGGNECGPLELIASAGCGSIPIQDRVSRARAVRSRALLFIQMRDAPWRHMTEKFAPPEVVIRRYPPSQVCDVVVRVRGQEIVHRCPGFSHALKWARLECKSYLISELRIEPPLGADFDGDDAPLFLRSPGPQ